MAVKKILLKVSNTFSKEIQVVIKNAILMFSYDPAAVRCPRKAKRWIAFKIMDANIFLFFHAIRRGKIETSLRGAVQFATRAKRNKNIPNMQFTDCLIETT